MDHREPEATTYRPIGEKRLAAMKRLDRLDPDYRLSMRAVAKVLPFKVDRYVLDELIDWQRVPDDPIFRLTFPAPEMLEPDDLASMRALVAREAQAAEIKAEADRIRLRMNPHPSGQMELNRVRLLDGTVLPGMQHKYRDTCLVFPNQGQTCHAYCTYCFRWAQFVGLEKLRFAQKEVRQILCYLKEHPEVSDVLFTGGDPMVMSARHLAEYIEPLLGPGFEHVRQIRIGTKSVAYWPQRFTSERDADAVLALFEKVVAAGKHLAVMAHYSHPRELSTAVAREAVRRIRATGAEVRCQSPLVRHVNDDPGVWAELWKEEVRLGAIPYYMFVERDTGPKEYFQVPLVQAVRIFRTAFSQVTGLARTVRGPSMSATPGKVQIDGVARIHGQKVFVCSFLRARNPDWVRRPFFARFDETACWLSDLEPAFGAERFFFAEAAGREPGRLELRSGNAW